MVPDQEIVGGLRAMLLSMDMEHARVVHSQLWFEFFGTGMWLNVDMEQEYILLCRSFIAADSTDVLPRLNETLCALVSTEMQVSMEASSSLLDSVFARIKALVHRPIRRFEASLPVRPDKTLLAYSVETTCQSYSHTFTTALRNIAALIARHRYVEAVSNLYAVFEALHPLLKRQDEAVSLYGVPFGYLDLVLDAATELYCHIRQMEDLEEDFAEDMDIYLVLLNQKLALFGDWSLSMYADMLLSGDQQSVDYSDINSLPCWNSLLENADVVSMAR